MDSRAVIVYAVKRKRADVSEDVYSLHAVSEIASGGQRKTFAVENKRLHCCRRGIHQDGGGGRAIETKGMEEESGAK